MDGIEDIMVHYAAVILMIETFKINTVGAKANLVFHPLLLFVSQVYLGILMHYGKWQRALEALRHENLLFRMSIDRIFFLKIHSFFFFSRLHLYVLILVENQYSIHILHNRTIKMADDREKSDYVLLLAQRKRRQGNIAMILSSMLSIPSRWSSFSHIL